MSHDQPVLDYAAPAASRLMLPRLDRVCAVAGGAGWGAVAGLLLALMLAPFVGAVALGRVPLLVPLAAAAGLWVQVKRVQGPEGRRRAGVAIAGAAVTILLYLWVIAFSSTHLRASMEHGMRLPRSAANIQCRGDALTSFSDRGAITWFEINGADLRPFLDRLDVIERGGAWVTVRTKGRVHRYWVEPSASLGNPEYQGFRKTWTGQEQINQRLRCKSPTGDFLNVEVWDIPGGRHVVKMYTDWN